MSDSGDYLAKRSAAIRAQAAAREADCVAEIKAVGQSRRTVRVGFNGYRSEARLSVFAPAWKAMPAVEHSAALDAVALDAVIAALVDVRARLDGGK